MNSEIKELNSVLHFYHTTQKILIQGSGTKYITEGIIAPHVKGVVETKEVEIEEENARIIESVKKS